MKNEFLEILNRELNDSKVKSDIINLSNSLIDFYEDNRVASTRKFKQMMDKYNYETISIFSEYSEYPHVTLFHGSGGLEFWPVIDYQGGVSDRDESIGSIIGEPEHWLNDDDYEINLKNEVIEWNWEVHRRIVFVWLSSIWQKIKGYEYGIVTKTLENNSTRQFIFNDLAWDNLSEYFHYSDISKRLNRHFEQDLSIAEIMERVKNNNVR